MHGQQNIKISDTMIVSSHKFGTWKGVDSKNALGSTEKLKTFHIIVRSLNESNGGRQISADYSKMCWKKVATQYL